MRPITEFVVNADFTLNSLAPSSSYTQTVIALFVINIGAIHQLGLYPFIIGGIIKAVLAAALVISTHKFFSKL